MILRHQAFFFNVQFRFEAGMSLLVDHSGRLFTRKRVTIKDIVANRKVGCWPNKGKMNTNYIYNSEKIWSPMLWESLPGIFIIFIIWPVPTCFQVVPAAVKGNRGKSRVSAYVLQGAILEYFTKHRLFPSGVAAEIASVRDWALRNAVAVKKLDSWLCHAARYSLCIGKHQHSCVEVCGVRMFTCAQACVRAHTHTPRKRACLSHMWPRPVDQNTHTSRQQQAITQMLAWRQRTNTLLSAKRAPHMAQTFGRTNTCSTWYIICAGTNNLHVDGHIHACAYTHTHLCLYVF